MKKLPLGVSTFSEIIEEDYIYVDKTRYIYKMINTGKVYFLSRPRRFGKSLLVSTLKSLFQGEKNLFKSLYIYDKWDWSEKYPVIHLDFGSRTRKNPEKLELSLNKFLNDTAEDYKIELEDIDLLADKFEELIKKLHKKAGKKVVILIDEYDKAILDSMKNIEIAKKNRDTLSSFYQVLKASDEHLKFIFLTGVSKFSKTSIFSGLNHLDDITLDHAFSNICGYSQEELETCFNEYIANLSKKGDIEKGELLTLIKKWYDGYSWDGNNRMYNPFSIISLFKKGIFRNYWYETGTPSFLIDFIRNNPQDSSVLLEKNTCIEGDFPEFDLEDLDLTTLLLQTGYLTIKSENIQFGELPQYELAIPNYEVNLSLFRSIIHKNFKEKSQNVTILAKKIFKAIRETDNKSLQKYFDILSSSIPAILYGKIKKDIREANFHIWFLSWFKLMGFHVTGEVLISHGTLDVLLEKDNLLIVCEIKYSEKEDLEKLAIKAVNQIKDNEYYLPYLEHSVILLGVGFSNREIKARLEPLVAKDS